MTAVLEDATFGIHHYSKITLLMFKVLSSDEYNSINSTWI